MEKTTKGFEHTGEAVLNEAQTLAFLRQHGIEPLESWSAGQVVLYVFPQRLREDHGELAGGELSPQVPESERPTIVRIDAPETIDFSHAQHIDGDQVYDLTVEKGWRTDYFVIDAATREPRLIKSSSAPSGEEDYRVYKVRRETLFAGSPLFPRGDSYHAT